MEKIVIDLNTAYTCDKLYSRIVWQKLFDIYRTTGGDLSYMDNMLCDLYSLKRFFKDGSFVTYWYRCGSFTVMEDFASPEETCYKIEYNADEHKVTIERVAK